jgi:predicted transglutaminase-like protease
MTLPAFALENGRQAENALWVAGFFLEFSDANLIPAYSERYTQETLLVQQQRYLANNALSRRVEEWCDKVEMNTSVRYCMMRIIV